MQKWKRSLLGLAGSAVLSGGMILNPMLDGMAMTAFAMSESEWNNNRGDADPFDPGERINGAIDNADDDDYYRFVLDETGKFSVDMTSYMKTYNLQLFKSDDRIWESGKKELSSTESRKDSYAFYLEKGTYYLKVSGNNTTGKYTIDTDFDKSRATENENNSSPANANNIVLGDVVKGMISMTDDKDYYKFEVSNDQKVDFEIKSYVGSFIFRIYDKNENKIYDSDDQKIESGKDYKKFTLEKDLSKGTYYICFTNTGDTGAYTGNYEIETKGTAANYTEIEHNDSRDQANDIALPTEIRGRIGEGDEGDYYKFSVSAAGNLNVDVKSYLEKYIVRVYDSNGKLVWEEELDRKKDDKFRYDGFNVELKSSGTYYLCFTNRDGCRGDYTINISMDGQSNPTPTPTPTPNPNPTPNPQPITTNAELKANVRGGYDVYINGAYQANSTYSGIAKFDNAYVMMENGVYRDDLNGVKLDPSDGKTFWFLAGGQVQTKHEGLALYDGEWFYIEGGRVRTDLNAFVSYDGGLFAVAAGRIVKEYSGLMQDPQNTKTGAWYFFSQGQAQTQYTGLAQYDGKWFYVEAGKLATNYTGSVRYDGSTFRVVNGMVQ